LKSNSWKVSEIVGFAVFDASGRDLGVLVDVLPTRTNDVWVVKGDKEMLIPALKGLVAEVDSVNKKILVNLPNGLWEIYR